MKPGRGSRWTLVATVAVALLLTPKAARYVSRLGEPVYGGKPVRVWVEEYLRPWGYSREHLETIAAIGKPAVPYLAEAVGKEESPAHRAWVRGCMAVRAKLPRELRKHWPEAYDTIWIREKAAMALGAIGPDAAAAIPALLRALHHPEREVTQRAAMTLNRLGPESQAAIPGLVAMLNEGPVHQSISVDTLYLIAAVAQPARAALLSCLTNAPPPTRIVAGRILSRMPRDPSEGVPLLIRLLESDDSSTRLAAALAARGVATPPLALRMRLVDLLPAVNPEEAAESMIALGNDLWESPDMLQTVSRLASEPGPAQAGAAYVLFQWGDDREQRLDTLIASLSGPRRLVALRAFLEIGASASRAGPAVALLRNDPDPWVSSLAYQAWQSFNSRSELSNLLTEPSPNSSR